MRKPLLSILSYNNKYLYLTSYLASREKPKFTVQNLLKKFILSWKIAIYIPGRFFIQFVGSSRTGGYSMVDATSFQSVGHGGLLMNELSYAYSAKQYRDLKIVLAGKIILKSAINVLKLLITWISRKNIIFVITLQTSKRVLWRYLTCKTVTLTTNSNVWPWQISLLSKWWRSMIIIIVLELIRLWNLNISAGVVGRCRRWKKNHLKRGGGGVFSNS